MATKTEGEAAAPEKKTYTVARGRTVHGEGDPVGPGKEIELDPTEGRRLQKLGFLVSDEEVLIDELAGPAFVRGAEITEK